MAADTSVVQPVVAPPLAPLKLKSKLATTPKAAPKFSTRVKNAVGAEVTLGDPRATRALVALMDVHAVVGGAACHWGGPAAFAEINAALHGIMFATAGRDWHEAFNFVNDAGHTENGIYALRANYGFDGMTLGFAERDFAASQANSPGTGESHLNPGGVLLSNGPLGSALPQAQGLAIGDKVAKRDRVTICTISDGASMEGEAKEAFAAIPGLAAKGRLNPFVLIVSDNDTKLSGRITKDAFSMQPSFAAMPALGWNVVPVPHGNDLPEVYLAMEKAIAAAKANPDHPVCVICKTVKGYGIKATEENAAGGHGFPLTNGENILNWMTELFKNDTVPAKLMTWAQSLRADWEKSGGGQKGQSCRRRGGGHPRPGQTQDRQSAGRPRPGRGARGHRRVAGVFRLRRCARLDRHQPVPEKFSRPLHRSRHRGVKHGQCGAGLSKSGFIPIVDTFGQFGVTKGNLPLTMAALSQAPVIAMFSHVGFQDAADGASHEATTYFAATSAIPHTVVIAPSCANEAESLMYQAIRQFAADRAAGKDGDSYVFFVGRENYPVDLDRRRNLSLGQGPGARNRR